MIGVWQPNERNMLIAPVLFKGRRRIGSNGKDLHSAIYKLIILISQARQLRAAIRSHKAAQECKYNRLAAEI